ncbi:MAG: antitoxin family protein [Pirellulales bacterium]
MIPAIFTEGVFRPLEPVAWPEGTQVQVQLPATVDAPSNELSPDELARQADAMSWPEFVERTYGSCAGLGLERHEYRITF